MICGEKRAKKQRSRQRSGIFEWLLFISPPRSGSKIEGRGTKVRFCQIRAWAGFDRRQAAAAAAAKSLQSCPTLCDHRWLPTGLLRPWDSPGKNTGEGCILPPVGFREEKAKAPHSRTLAWKIPWTEEPGRLQSVGSLRVGHD